MKKEINFLLLLLIFASVSLSTITFTFPKYDGQRINYTSYQIGWLWDNDTGDWKSFRWGEAEVNTTDLSEFKYTFTNTANSSEIISNNNGIYYYVIKAYDNSLGSGSAIDISPIYSLIVDTTPPTVSSKSPTGVNEPLTGNVVVTFDESMNTSSFSISSDSGNISFGTPTWSDNDKTVTVPYTATNEGEEFTVHLGAKDLAGNVVNDSLSFITLVKPTTVVINSPESGGSYVQGDSVSFSVTVTGAGGEAVRGATVTVSGGCSTTLSESNPGVYSGSCTVSDYGSLDFTVTAVNGGQQANNTVTLSVVKKAGLVIEVLEPSSFTFTRGDSIPVSVRVTSEDGTVTSADVSSNPSLNFTKETGNVFTATLPTSYDSPENLQLRITATATVNVGGKSQQATASKTLSFSLSPVQLTLEVTVLGNGEEKPVLRGGDEASVRVRAFLPDGTPAEIKTVNGTLTVRSASGEQNIIPLSFVKSTANEWVTNESVYTVRSVDSSLEASVSVEDEAGNTGSTTVLQRGPVQGLKFEITSPESFTFAKGQTITIRGKVYSEAEKTYVSNAEVFINGEKFTVKGNEYEYSYKLNDSFTGTLTLLIHMKYKDVEDVQQVQFTITDSLQAAISPVVKRGEAKFELKYPDGTPVTNGSFKFIIGDNAYDLEYENGYWTASVDLGRQTLAGVPVKIIGTDANGNQLLKTANVEYDPNLSFFEKNWQTLLLVAIMLIASFLAFLKMKAKHLEKLEREKIKREYVEALVKLKTNDVRKKRVRMLKMSLSLSPQEEERMLASLDKEKEDLESTIAMMESRYNFIRKNKDKLEKEANKETEKRIPLIKEQTVYDIKKGRIISFIVKEKQFGAKTEEQIINEVRQKWPDIADKVIEEAKAQGILGKQEKKPTMQKQAQEKQQATSGQANLVQVGTFDSLIVDLRQIMQKKGVTKEQLLQELRKQGMSEEVIREISKRL